MSGDAAMAHMDEVEAQALVENPQRTAAPSRWRRTSLIVGTGVLLLGAVVLASSSARPATTAPVLARDDQIIQKAETVAVANGADGSTVVVHSTDPEPPPTPTLPPFVGPAADVINSHHQNKEDEVCKMPKPTNVKLPQRPQCQHSLWKHRIGNSIENFNLHISPANWQWLQANPKAGEYVDCNMTVNYKQRSMPYPNRYIYGAECRYKGSTGSFMGCTKRDGSANPGGKDCRQLSMKVKVSKAKTLKGEDATKVLGVSKLQFMGMMHDDSLIRNHLGYTVLQDLELPASCTVPANVFINGLYSGVSDLTEQVDSYFLEARVDTFFKKDKLKGKGALWKEMWPKSPDPEYYKTVQPIPDFAKQDLEQKSIDGDNGYNLYADFYQAASACFALREKCTKAKAKEILDKFTVPDSWIDAIVGMTYTSNSDQPLILHHNFYFYILNNRFYYIPWDFNQVFYDITGSPIPGYEVAAPWYEYLDDNMRKKVCPYPVPSSSSDLNQKRFNAFTCDPVGFIMGIAWKDLWLDRVKSTDNVKLLASATNEIALWSEKIASSVECGAANGGWPPSVEDQREACKPIAPMYKYTMQFYRSVADGTLAAWPSPTFADFPRETVECLNDAGMVAMYLGQAGIMITDGVKDCAHTSAYEGHDGVLACTNDISNVISAFGFVSSFLSGMLTVCPFQDSAGFAQRGIKELYHQAPFQTGCAAETSRVVAGLAAISASSTGIADVCVPGVAYKRGQSAETARRLVATHFDENRDTQIASCVFDAAGATTYLVRAALSIDAAVSQCGTFYGDSARCSWKVNAVIESFAYLGYFLSDSIAQCAKEAKFPGIDKDAAFKATCAADISQLVGSLESVASGGSGMANNCGEDKLFPRNPPFETIDMPLEPKRKLNSEEYVKEMDAAKEAWEAASKGDKRKLKEWYKRNGGLTENKVRPRE